MDFSLAFFGGIPQRFVEVFGVIVGDPLVYLPLLGMWLMFEVYYIISSSDGDVKESDLLENSVSTIYVAFVISPVFEEGLSLAAFSDPTPRTILSIILFCYAGFLIIAAYTKMLPQFMVHILGGASLDMFATMLALLYVDGKVPIDLATIAVIFIPIALMYVLQTLRKFGRGY